LGGAFRIGTSGWAYDHWQDVFYPPDLPKSRRLDFYQKEFDTVEVNSTFYRLPGDAAVEGWCDQAPEGFRYAVKASRFLTHMKRLLDPEEPLDRFLQKANLLEEKLGPILFQLPPRFRVNLERLEAFLDLLPSSHRYALEFRDASWYAAEVYELLERHDVALVLHDSENAPAPQQLTSELVYVRFHGPGKDYQGDYPEHDLASWVEPIGRWRSEGRDVSSPPLSIAPHPAPEPPLARGSRITYRLRLFGLPLKWHTEIVRIDPPWGFVDVQRRGPYAEWVHTHSFRPLPGADPGGRSTEGLLEARAVLMEDRVDYRLPFGPLGLLAAPLVALQLIAIFGFRKRRVDELFPRQRSNGQDGHAPPRARS